MENDGHLALASTALVMGLASIPLCLFMNLGVVIGGIAIVLAILSKGTLEKLLPQARKAIIYGTIGIIVGYSVFAYDFHRVLTVPEERAALNAFSEKLYGVSFDDMLKQYGVQLGD